MWFPYAFTFAAITSVSIIIAKRVMSEIDEYLYLAVGNLFAIPFLLLIVIYFYEIPKIDEIFIRSVLISSAIGIVAAIFAYRAIRISEISLVSPISAFNPIFTAIVSLVLLGERITTKSVLGILIICLGAYLLELSKANRDYLKPLKSLLTNKGVQLSLAAYFLWAITPVFEKTAIFHTFPQVPPFVSLVGYGMSTTVFMSLAAVKSRPNFKKIKKFLLIFLVLGLLSGLGQTTAMIAFSSGNLGLVTAVFKLSMIFSVILGWVLFKEKNLRDRLLGSTVMLLGVILLVT